MSAAAMLAAGYHAEAISEDACGCRYFATGVQTFACDQHAEMGHEGDAPDSDDDISDSCDPLTTSEGDEP